VSVIKDDGSVVDITISQTKKGIGKIDFTEENQLWFTAQQSSSDPDYWRVILAPIPNSDISASYWQSFASTELSEYAYADYGSLPALASQTYSQGITYATAPLTVGGNKGFSKLIHNSSDPTNSSVAYITSKYNTGYMTGDIRGAWNVDTDVTALSGTELVTNGSSFTTTTGFTSASGGVFSVVNSKIHVTGASGDGTFGVTYAVSTPTVGATYVFEIVATNDGSAGSRVGSTAGSSNLALGAVLTTNDSSDALTFVAAGTTSYLTHYVYGAGKVGDITSISVREAIPDRSVKGNGLVVHGSPTVSAVATGAELKCISGFSTSNYLEQPYNSDLDFGTGDFSFSVWAKSPVSGSAEYLMDRADSDGSNRSGFYISGTGSLSLVGYYSSGSVSKTVPSPVNWTHFVMARSGTTTSLYVNGVSIGSGTGGGSENLTGDGTASFKLGARYTNSEHWQGSLALPRISATVPTAEQIKEIYEAEKPLFQANAKCTLNGSSDAVTALAYDDSTELLHVGTSGGRSAFQGLRRVAETSTSTTEIAAQGGLIVEET
jgi:hypothetical protein